MDALKLTFVNGETIQFPFGPDSTLKIETPDGINGLQHGAWGEITDVAYVTDAGEVVATTVVAGPIETAAPAETAAAAETTAAVTGDGTETIVEDPTLLQKVEAKLGLGHDTVVADTQTAVDVASTGTADDPAAHLTAALADADVAIAAFPDSPELADLKSQLEAIQADESAHSGA